MALSPRSIRCNIFPACPYPVGGETTGSVGFCKQICRNRMTRKSLQIQLFIAGLIRVASRYGCVVTSLLCDVT
jgi:hypothetical protein